MNVGFIQLRCPICQELVGADTTYSLLCGHIFDEHCIRTWLKSSRKCPCCRATARADQLVKMHFDFATPTVHGVEATPAGTGSDTEDEQEDERVELKETSEHEEQSTQSSRMLPLPSYRLSHLFNPCNIFGRFSHVGPIIVVYIVGVLLPFYVGKFGEAQNTTKYTFRQYFFCLTFMMRAFVHSVDVYTIVYWLREIEQSKRSYGARNFVILCDLLFCVIMLILLVNFMHPFMLQPTREVQYHLWCYPTHDLNLRAETVNCRHKLKVHLTCATPQDLSGIEDVKRQGQGNDANKVYLEGTRGRRWAVVYDYSRYLPSYPYYGMELSVNP